MSAKFTFTGGSRKNEITVAVVTVTGCMNHGAGSDVEDTGLKDKSTVDAQSCRFPPTHGPPRLIHTNPGAPVAAGGMTTEDRLSGKDK